MFKRLTVTTALVAAGLFGTLNYSAIAETNQTEQSAPSSSRSQMSALDRQFITDAAHGGMAEVRLGQLALQRSNNAQVRQFAQRMIDQHTQANRELMALAQRKGVTPPNSPGPKYEAAMNRLMQLSGDSFDEAYLNEAGVNSHLEAAAVYQRQARMGQDADLRAFATRTLPTVQGHLEMAATMTGYSLARGSNDASDTSDTPAMPMSR
ncbi:DUF4142 domain-containing protein [Aerosakkonema sp. BLCC-F183]|uniref:DUF4142 domain-containing protein n=1 Tax=Aerosakkonema sp. BLCC-F183 TaxID=3342834 RepID=UPI0035B79C7E